MLSKLTVCVFHQILRVLISWKNFVFSYKKVACTTFLLTITADIFSQMLGILIKNVICDKKNADEYNATGHYTFHVQLVFMLILCFS